MQRARVFTAASLLAFIAMAAGCGGGSTSLSQTPSAPASSVSVPVGSAATVARVSAGALTATISIPATQSGSGTLTVTGSGSLPSGDPTLSATRHVETVRDAADSGNAGLAFLTLSSNAAITFGTFPTLAFTLPSTTSTSGESFYLALLVPGASSWTEPIAGPGVLGTGNTITFDASSVITPITPFTLNAGAAYQFALYEVASATPTGAPTLTPIPNTSSSPVISATATPASASTPMPTATPIGTGTSGPGTPVPGTPVPGTPAPTASPSPTATPVPTASPVPTISPEAGAPTISSISPTQGAVGSMVVINGTNFTGLQSVTFAGNVAASGTFTATTITVTVPQGALSGPITVQTQNGSAASATFTVTAPTPTPLPTAPAGSQLRR